MGLFKCGSSYESAFEINVEFDCIYKPFINLYPLKAKWFVLIIVEP